uniref:Nucleophosmin/nucleoplasmin 2 n=1 Tax=Aquila chrysaetos chrysaetos TaxID=223781 RepID=A0A663E828_AQUCH
CTGLLPPPPPPNPEQPHCDTSLPAGCELSSEQDSYTFQVPEEWQCEQQLALRTICLGEMARDEFHVVEIVLAEGGARSPVPLATLKPSVLPMVSATLMGVELTPPVTFHLRAGSGPVYITGAQPAVPTVMSNLSWDEEEEEEDAEEEEPAEESPKKPPKGQADKKGNAAKVSTPLAGDAVCGGVPVPWGGGSMQPPLLGASHALIPRDGLLCAPTEPQPQTPLCEGGEP